MKELTTDNLQEVIANNNKVIVQYGASWCGACRLVKPQLSRLSEENPGAEFYYVDAEKYPNSRTLAKVENLPTFASFKDGQLVGQATGTNMDNVKGLINEITSN